MTTATHFARHPLLPAAGVPAVEATALRKEFQRGRRTLFQRLRREPDKRERFAAVDGIDLRVEQGEIFGVLGPNGAGKTTTMRMIATLLEPTAGVVRVLGLDATREPREVRRRFGAVLSGERSLYWKLTARENLEYFAALYHVPPTETQRRIDAVLETVKLTDRADDYVERYSMGMRQRLVLARALLPDPPLLLLDEPTVGLDPQAARDMRERVRDLREQGRTVLITTHYMEEADQLCDRIAIIDHGRIVALDAPAALKRTIRAEEVVHLEVVLPEDASGAVGADGGDAAGRLLAAVAPRGTLARHERDGRRLELTVHCASAREFVPVAFDAASAVGASVAHVEIVPVTLEDVFLALTGRALRE
jgi:ABC-2 type transport system ATP-binding protein